MNKRYKKNDHEWEVITDEEGNILFSYDKTASDNSRANPPHVIDAFEFDRILQKNVRILNGKLCPNCERDPCECVVLE